MPARRRNAKGKHVLPKLGNATWAVIITALVVALGLTGSALSLATAAPFLIFGATYLVVRAIRDT